MDNPSDDIICTLFVPNKERLRKIYHYSRSSGRNRTCALRFRCALTTSSCIYGLPIYFNIQFQESEVRKKSFMYYIYASNPILSLFNSCCVIVKNIERTLFFLPRDKVLYHEVVAHDKHIDILFQKEIAYLRNIRHPKTAENVLFCKMIS